MSALVSAPPFPDDTVVRITDEIGGVEFQGSGVLIDGGTEVLTASHLVETGTGNGVATTAQEIVVTPDYEPGLAPFGSLYGTSVNYVPINDSTGGESFAASQMDLAVIHLAGSFAGVGSMAVGSGFAGGMVNLAGYPGSAGGVQVDSTQSESLIPGYALLDGAGASPGSSGGPLWILVGGVPTVVGLVSSGIASTGETFSTQLTAQDVALINSWSIGGPSGGIATPYFVYGADAVSGSKTLVIEPTASVGTGLLVQNSTLPEDGLLQGAGAAAFADPDGTAAMTLRVYQAVLGRIPTVADGQGFLNNAVSVERGAPDGSGNQAPLSAEQLAQAMLSSPEAQSIYGGLGITDFVDTAYEHVLHRAPDPGGLASWTNDLLHGDSEAFVLSQFATSVENEMDTQYVAGSTDLSEVDRLYKAALGRVPDQGGLLSWVSNYDSGQSVATMASEMMGSAEFQSLYGGAPSNGAFVNLLYQNVLGRAPDGAGQANWLNQLASGMSRGAVLAAFSDSTENRIATSTLTHDGLVVLPA